jgi:hypothetical protein
MTTMVHPPNLPQMLTAHPQKTITEPKRMIMGRPRKMPMVAAVKPKNPRVPLKDKNRFFTLTPSAVRT